MVLDRIKTVLAKVIRALPVNSETIGVPKGVGSTQDYVNRFRSDNKVAKASYQKVYDSSPVTTIEPQSIDKEIHWRFKSDRQTEFPAAFVTVIPNGRVWNNSAIITPNNKFLADVSKSHAKVKLELPKHHPIYREWKLHPVHFLKGNVAVLSVPGGNTYAHWLLDLLPRLHLLERSSHSLSNIDYFIVNGTELPFQRETLATVGIPQEKLIDGTQYPHIKAEKLIVPSLPRPTVNVVQWTSKWICDFLKYRFVPNSVENYSDNRFEKIYISRAKANRRRVINEAEVIKILSQFGFRQVFLESMSIAQQALLFASAKYIVAPHGAGLANLAFCQPGTKVLEIFPPNYLLLDYWVLSNQLRLNYYYLIGKGERPGKELYSPNYAENIEVNLDALLQVLKLGEEDDRLL